MKSTTFTLTVLLIAVVLTVGAAGTVSATATTGVESTESLDGASIVTDVGTDCATISCDEICQGPCLSMDETKLTSLDVGTDCATISCDEICKGACYSMADGLLGVASA